MKKIILTIICFLAMASFVCAGTNVTFQWDANSESDLAGYKIYRSNVSGDYSSPANVLDIPLSALADTGEPQYTEEDVPDGEWFWVATAYDTSGNESGYSNEVTDSLDATAPETPQNLTIWQKIIAWFKKHFRRWG